MDLYRILISNPAKWAHTLIVITYDEHSGFFDHEPPLPGFTVIGDVKLDTAGARVLASLVSPFVKPGVPFTGPLDHTSILQLLADRFADMKYGYSKAIDDRQAELKLNRIYQCLSDEPANLPAPRLGAPIVAPIEEPVPARRGAETPNEAAYRHAVEKLNSDHPEILKAAGWEKVNACLAAGPSGKP